MDPIEFHSEEEPYKNRLDSYQKRTGLMEAVQTGRGQLNGIPLAIGIMDFQFMGGSMGSILLLQNPFEQLELDPILVLNVDHFSFELYIYFHK